MSTELAKGRSFAELLADLEAVGGCFTPELEAEWNGHQLKDKLRAVWYTHLRLEDLKARKKELDRWWKEDAFGPVDDAYQAMRGKLAEVLSLEAGAVDPDNLFSAKIMQSDGEIELAPGCTIEQVPDAYLKWDPRLDTEAIHAALDRGEVVPGIVRTSKKFLRITPRAEGKDLKAALELERQKRLLEAMRK